MNQPELSPQQETDYGQAYELAHQANAAFDRRREAARDLTRFTRPETSRERETIKEALKGAGEDFELSKAAADTLMPSRAAFETAEPTEAFASEAVWSAMSPEQRTKAGAVRAALAEGPLKEKGLTIDSWRVVSRETDGKTGFSLVGDSIDIGDPKENYDPARNYKSVMSPADDQLFQVEVNGQVYDTRGMRGKVYDAKVADARERGVALPDSEQLAQETGDVLTYTMMTGDPLTEFGVVQLRGVSGGVVRGYVTRPGSDDRCLRVCPAVDIE